MCFVGFIVVTRSFWCAGEGGRVGAKGATLSQYVLQQIVVHNPDDRDKDPRAAILRHADDAAKNPYWLDQCYTE